MKMHQKYAALAVAGLASLLAPAVASAAGARPQIAGVRASSSSLLSITNRAQLLRAHPRSKVAYAWQAELNGHWISVANADAGSFRVPAHLRPDLLRVTVRFTSYSAVSKRRTKVTLVSNVSAPTPSVDSATPAVGVGSLPTTYIPNDWSGPNPPDNCAGSPHDAGNGPSDNLVNLDYCGATLEGLQPLPLPANWAQLTDLQRGFVLLNLERIERGETALLGESATLDTWAMKGAQADDDPNPPGSVDWTGSNWFGGTDSTDAVDGYIYNDGPGSDNLACSGKATWGCWGHRDNILENATDSDLAVGLADGTNGDSTELFGRSYTDFTFSWAQELTAGYPQGLPSSFTLTAPTVSSMTTHGTTITITGQNLDTVTRVYFSDANATPSWSCSSPNTCNFSAKGLSPNTTYTVYLLNPAGLSAPAGRYTTAP